MRRIDELFQAAAASLSKRRPESTYRLQLHAGFTFDDAAAIVSYLATLGITHAYASPYFVASPGSTHGYDVVDPTRLNPEIGSQESFDGWVAELGRHGMSHVLDIVPNHMGVATNENAWWNDLLKNGRSSRYAAFFDIAWRGSPRPELHDKVLLPVLGKPYGQTLESGELKLVHDRGAFHVEYFSRRFPIDPRTYPLILGHGLEKLEGIDGEAGPLAGQFREVLAAIDQIPDCRESTPEAVADRARQVAAVEARLDELAKLNDAANKLIARNVGIFNGAAGDGPHRFDPLDHLLDRQCYRLACWRTAPDEINYRRFFDINDLAALAMEREEVFEASHALALHLIAQGRLAGVRIDHPDGLYDPAQYFQRLQRHALLAVAERLVAEGPRFSGMPWEDARAELVKRLATASSPTDPITSRPMFVVAEKILAPGEPLPADWVVDGTSGYDFLNVVNGLYVDRRNEAALTQLHADLVPGSSPFEEMAYEAKRLILRTSLASELRMLALLLDRLAQMDRGTRDFTLSALTDALAEVIACFPVYRSYVSDRGLVDADRAWVETAVVKAIERSPTVEASTFGFIRDALLLKYPATFSQEQKAAQRRFAGKFQQLTAPVTAKGVEDTAFYRYQRLVTLNEVGGDPGRFGTPPAEAHTWFQERAAKWPYALSCLSTHDTKRSEDVRARLNVVSELPDAWGKLVRTAFEVNAPLRQAIGGEPAPAPDEEYLLYQTLLGAWPLEPASPEEHAKFLERVQAYMAKAMKEAKLRTSWTRPNKSRDAAVLEFVAKVLHPHTGAPFLEIFRPFQAMVSHFGLLNSLSQTLLRLAAPGVPDTYQGTESWDFSLVDPDNRRPVDYAARRAMLAALQTGAKAAGNDRGTMARDLAASLSDGRGKLYLTWKMLLARREWPGLFLAGEYQPVEATGASAATSSPSRVGRGTIWRS